MFRATRAAVGSSFTGPLRLQGPPPWDTSSRAAVSPHLDPSRQMPRMWPLWVGYRNFSSVDSDSRETTKALVAPSRSLAWKNIQLDHSPRGVPIYIRWSLLSVLAVPVWAYFKYRKSLDSRIEVRDKLITAYVYVDLAKGDRYLGRLLIGLFGDVVPMTVANFTALAEGYPVGDKILGYCNTEAQVVIPGRLAVFGDVASGRGAHSISIYGRKFPDENFQLPYLRRGDVGMLGQKPHANGSTFFITLRALPEYNGRFVLFGTVVAGLELLATLSADVDPNSRSAHYGVSVDPIKIVGCGVYRDAQTNGPPSFIADRVKGYEPKVSYATGHSWQPMADAWQGFTASMDAARKDLGSQQIHHEEIKSALRKVLRPHLTGRAAVSVVLLTHEPLVKFTALPASVQSARLCRSLLRSRVADGLHSHPPKACAYRAKTGNSAEAANNTRSNTTARNCVPAFPPRVESAEKLFHVRAMRPTCLDAVVML